VQAKLEDQQQDARLDHKDNELRRGHRHFSSVIQNELFVARKSGSRSRFLERGNKGNLPAASDNLPSPSFSKRGIDRSELW
jgi:hypothetical protein